MTVLEWANIISNYGFAIIALIVIVKWLGPKLDQMWDAMLDLKKANKPHETVEDVVAMNSCIRSVLQDMLSDFSADWCHLWQFHNGVRSMGSHGLPWLYITMTHEVKRSNLPSLIQAFEHIPLSMFDDFATSLISSDILIHKKSDTIIESQNKIGLLMQEFGSEEVLIRAIRDENGSVVAFISCACVKEHIISNKDILLFRNYTQRMSATLAKVPDEILMKC